MCNSMKISRKKSIWYGQGNDYDISGISGRLICTVCDFDFLKFYGKRGKDFSEAHHMIPVSEMSEDHFSKPEDMAIVCANSTG